MFKRPGKGKQKPCVGVHRSTLMASAAADGTIEGEKVKVAILFTECECGENHKYFLSPAKLAATVATLTKVAESIGGEYKEMLDNRDEALTKFMGVVAEDLNDVLQHARND
jgi:hypothetical protein